MAESAKIAKVIRAHYHSWQEFAEQYIEGVGMESGVADKKPMFVEIYNKISALPDSPYSVDWNTPIQ